uniref:Integrase core domain containing protein n=1 Tax=Solanum tuberosum TaxID=4113 RepID=M1D9I3_SOLTU
MEQMMDHKVQAIHQCLDAFELRILERPSPTTDFSAFRMELASLWADLDTLLAPLEIEAESAPTTPVDNTVLNALFRDEMLPPNSSRHAGKIPAPVVLGRISKTERQETKVARRSSIIDEELRQ